MSGSRIELPRRTSRILTSMLPDPGGHEIREELAQEHAALSRRRGPVVAWLWYAAQLLAPSTWILAVELRRSNRRRARSSTGSRRSMRGIAGPSLLDVRLAVRMLGKQPMLTGVAVLALGLGIPASLSVIHLRHAQMGPLPHEAGERIVGIRHWDVQANRQVYGSPADFALWREELTTFAALGAVRAVEWNVHADDGRAEPVRGAEITASGFEILRVPPLLGRTLDPADEVPEAPDVVVISADLWASRFGSDPDIVGSAVRIAGVPHTVVGIMPEGFLFPRSHRLWLPMRSADPTIPGSQGFMWVFGRLGDDVSMEQAGVEVATLVARMAARSPETHGRLRGEVVTIPTMAWGAPADEAGDPVIIAAQLLPLLLLMVMCGNVGIMILARTASRTREFATRTALGASRVRIVLLVFSEGLVLALVATGVGLVIANWALGRFEALEALRSPYWMSLGLGPRTVSMALALAVLSAGITSVVPALKATGPGVGGPLARGALHGVRMRFGAGSTALIVLEVALAVGALSGAVAWSVASFRATRGDMGIDLDRYLSAELVVPSAIDTPGATPADSAELRGRLRLIQSELKRRVSAEPGVRTVAVARTLPGEGPFFRRLQVEEVDGYFGSEAAAVAVATVDTDFFADMRHAVLLGRDFAMDDASGPAEPGVVIVNTTFVEQVLEGRNPLGRRIRYAGSTPTVEHEIVGVVGPLAMNPVNPDLDAGVYYPAAPGDIYPVGLVVRVEGDPLDFVPRLRVVAAEVDPVAMIRAPGRLSDLAEQGVAPVRYLSVAAVLLSAMAIFLSASGLYALMSFTIAQRTGEIGVRTALGARPWSIVSAVGRRAAYQLLAGVTLGAVLAAPPLVYLSRLPSLRPEGLPAVVLGVVLGTLLVGALACLRPILRGLRVQPTEALRVE